MYVKVEVYDLGKCIEIPPSFMQFSLRCVKYDRHGYKPRQRVFLITDSVSLIIHVYTCLQLFTLSLKQLVQQILSANEPFILQIAFSIHCNRRVSCDNTQYTEVHTHNAHVCMLCVYAGLLPAGCLQLQGEGAVQFPGAGEGDSQLPD